MAKKWIVRIVVAAMIGVVPVSLSNMPAAAAPEPTPNGFIGACNMVESWPGVNEPGVPPGGGMQNAMSVDATQGNDGMDRAVSNTGGVC